MTKGFVAKNTTTSIMRYKSVPIINLIAILRSLFSFANAKRKTTNGIKISDKEEIFVATNIAETNAAREIKKSDGFSRILRQIYKSNNEKKDNHISNVPKWANWINPVEKVTRVVVKRAAFVFLLIFLTSKKLSGIRRREKTAENILLINTACENGMLIIEK